MKLSIVLVVVTLAIAATYSYNSLKDIKEDKDNPLHPSPLKELELSGIMRWLPHLLFIGCLLISFLFTNLYSFILLVSFILFSLLYSHFKIKKFLIIKTITVSFFYVILFFSCYLAFSTTLTYELFLAGFLAYMVLFTYSVVSDMRDIKSDEKHNLITIPVRYGYKKSEGLLKGIFLSLNLIAVFLYLLGLISLKLMAIFYLFMPFQICLLYCLRIRNLYVIDVIKDMSFVSITGVMLIFLFAQISYAQIFVFILKV